MKFIQTLLLAVSVAVLTVPAQAVTDAQQKALAAIEADPDSDAALTAIQQLVMDLTDGGKNMPVEGPVIDRLGELLLERHASRPNVVNTAIVYSFSVQPQKSIPFMRALYDRMPPADARRSLAPSLLSRCTSRGHDRAVSEVERKEVRRNATEFAQQLHRDYPGDEQLLKHAVHTVNAFNFSLSDPLTDIHFPLVDGGRDGLGKYRGNIMVVDIWATWCGPCVAAQPGLVKFQQEMQGRPLEIIALSMDRKPGDVVAHRVKQAMPWVNGYIGMGAPVLNKWGIASYPTYFVLDAQGTIRARVTEFDDATKQYVRELVSELEKDRQRDAAALQAIEADPASDAAFDALNKLVFRLMGRGAFGMDGDGFAAEDLKRIRRTAELMLLHHAKRPGAERNLSMYDMVVPPIEGARLMRSLGIASGDINVLGRTAPRMLMDYLHYFDDPHTSPAERTRVRQEIQALTDAMRRDLAASPSMVKRADTALVALDYSIGARLPVDEFPTVTGGKATLSSQRGRIVLVDFWATWCEPCVAAQPAMVELKEELKGRKFEMFALSMDRKPEDVIKHERTQSMPWINAYIGLDAPLHRQVGIHNNPTYFLLDGDGVILARFSHFDENSKEYIRGVVDRFEAAARK